MESGNARQGGLAMLRVLAASARRTLRVLPVAVVSGLFIGSAVSWAGTLEDKDCDGVPDAAALTQAKLPGPGGQPTRAPGHFALGTATASQYPASDPPNPPLFTQEWDWEKETTVKYKNAQGEVVDALLPWFQGADTDIPAEIASDHKKSDGWVLLYNFVDGKLVDSLGQPVEVDHATPFFALYNKYRGMVRFFYFHNKETTYTDFMFGLVIDGAGAAAGETTLFNFTEDFAKSDATRPRFPFLQRANIKKFGTSGPIRYHWHSFDVELAYDPLVETRSYSELLLRWQGRGIDVTQLTLDGKITGCLIGNIDIAGSNNSFNLGSLTFNNGTVGSFNSSVTINKTADAATKVQAKAQGQVDKFIKAKLEQLWKDLQNKAVNFITSPLGSLFGSLLGGSKKEGPKEPNVNLRLDADIHLQGTMVLAQPVFEPTMKVPGTKYGAGAKTIVPHYDLPLGVLTLSAAPEVVWREFFDYGPYFAEYSEYVYMQTYFINPASFEVKLNPSVAQDLQIKSVKTSLYYYRTYSGATKLDGIGLTPDQVGAVLVDSEPNSIIYEGGGGIINWYRNVLPYPWDLWDNGTLTYGPDQKVVVKVTVELEPPKDSTAGPIVWSKTYRPRYTQDRSQSPVAGIDPPGEFLPPIN